MLWDAFPDLGVEDGGNQGTGKDNGKGGYQIPCPLAVGLVALGSHRLHEVVHHRRVADREAHGGGEVEDVVRDIHSTQTGRAAMLISLAMARKASRPVCIAIASDIA
jgi:hypothetical protein